MAFHLGKPILVMLGISATCAAVLWFRPAAPPRGELLLWVFAEAHARTYGGEPDQKAPSLLKSFQDKTGLRTDMQLIFDRALGVRLISMFMADMRGPTVPDVVEVEINSIGKFFRPPVREVGFLPLNAYLEKTGVREIDSLDQPGQEGWRARFRGDDQTYRHADGRWEQAPGEKADAWIDQITRSRFAPYTKDGVIFGIPHDVHPVALAYRHDLFLEAGIDLLKESGDATRPMTWPRFHELCLAFRQYWKANGKPTRYPIELKTMGTDNLVVMLLQRHMNLIDKTGRIQFNDPGFAETVAFYAQMVAGDRQIGTAPGAGDAAIAQDLNDGNICAFMTADWRVRYLKDFAYVDRNTGRKALEGKLRFIPLPVFEPGKDARTGTWGGTMIGIVRNTPRPDDAWKLIEHLYLSDEGFEARIRETNILPPVVAQWDDPRFDRPDPFFGGQMVDQLYVELARELPDRYVQPASRTALAALNGVLYKAVGHVRARGESGLLEACRGWLKDAAVDLDERIKWGTFE
ncbi:MAG TPA: extracellular solute-binding protein [Tepidisphaeraceae bacterium]|nr:extracellular solute-binding protein [Tepidisphaeraceae bacterium]